MSEKVLQDDGLPKGWVKTRLGEVGFIFSGGTPSTTNPNYFDGEFPWITPADLSGYREKLIGRGRRTITQEGLKNSSAVLLPEGSLLFSSRAPVGYVAIAANPLATNQGFKNLVLANGLSTDYASTTTSNQVKIWLKSLQVVQRSSSCPRKHSQNYLCRYHPWNKNAL